MFTLVVPIFGATMLFGGILAALQQSSGDRSGQPVAEPPDR
jgi:hypothetical protein